MFRILYAILVIVGIFLLGGFEGLFLGDTPSFRVELIKEGLPLPYNIF